MAQATPATKPFRIDVHHHLSPPSYITASKDLGFGEGLMRSWTIEKSLEDMDKAGTATAMLSVTTPGINPVQPDVARRLCRESNEYAAKLVADYPGRFGNFAMLPLRDAEGSLREIEYALDALKADGIALMTSYNDKWLGDPLFLPVMEELNRRKALVYTHPTAANCCVNLVPTQQPVMIEFGTDTTRTIADIVFSGNAQKFRDIRWIFSHSGGTLPFLTSRFVELAGRMRDRMPNGPMPIFQRFYYEVAQGNTPGQLAALMEMVNISQVMFGSDYPFRRGAEAVEGVHHYKFSPDEIKAIDSGNAIRAMPGLKV